MTATHPSARLLLALLTLGQTSEAIDLFSVSDEAGLTLFGALRGLAELSEQGLISASRMRLTMSGLSMACSLAAGEGCSEFSQEPIAVVERRAPAQSEAERRVAGIGRVSSAA